MEISPVPVNIKIIFISRALLWTMTANIYTHADQAEILNAAKILF